LFAFLLVGQPIWWFWIQLTIFNLLLVYLILRQENMAESLEEAAVTWQNSV